MIFHDIEQNTDEWMNLRKRKFTASSFKDLFMKETTATYQDAIYKVVFERLTDETPESFSNDWMQRGHNLEAEAREWYELESYNKTHNGGFFEFNEWIGASPDGLVGKDGLVEIKCPKYSTLIRYLLDKKLPTIYEWQIHGQLWVADKQFCDFVAYHPKLTPLVIRIQRDIKKDIILGDQLFEAIEKAENIIKRLK